LKNGVDVVRLNFSHGTHDDHARVVERIRRLEVELGKPVAILQDLCGPKIRGSRFTPGDSIELATGSEVTIVAGLEEANGTDRFGASYGDLASDVKVGERIKVKVVAIDDLGRIRLSRKALMAPAEGDAEGASVAADEGQGPHHERPRMGGGEGRRGGGRGGPRP
jgi:pyruvate kinase